MNGMIYCWIKMSQFGNNFVVKDALINTYYNFHQIEENGKTSKWNWCIDIHTYIYILEHVMEKMKEKNKDIQNSFS